MTHSADVIIAGGGPAGAATALSLKQLGYAVTVITSPRTFVACEGISERVVQGMHNAGFHHALETIAEPSPRHASWNGTRSAANTERLIRRDLLDHALTIDMEEAQVRVIHGRIKQTQIDDGRAHVSGTSHAGDDFSLSAEFFVDARGRSAPGGAQARMRGPQTVSLLQRWQGEPCTAQSAAASFDDGWAWLARFKDGSRYTQLTLAADDIPPKPELAGFFFQLLQQVEEANHYIADASLSGDIHARSATAILTCDPIGERTIRIGDAALAVDPLSGNGIFQSLSTALLAPRVINTVLNRPLDAELARQFYRERVNHAFMRFARMGRDFYQQESRWADRPFWQQRQSWPDQQPMHEPLAPDTITIGPRPVVYGDFITEEEVVMTPDQPLGIWHLEGIPLAPLSRELLNRRRLDQAPGSMDEARQLVEKILRQQGHDLTGANLAAILAWLYEQGLIGPKN